MNTKLENNLKDLLNKYSNDINANQFDEIYKEAITLDDLEPSLVSYLTAVLHSAGIHPENYMSYIPRHFLYDSNIEEFTIPDNIRSIKTEAFSGSCLTQIKIPKQVETVGDDAFYMCDDLESVYIDNVDTIFGFGVFTFCDKLKKFTVNCYETDLENVIADWMQKDIFHSCPLESITCLDGEYYL